MLRSSEGNAAADEDILHVVGSEDASVESGAG